MASSQNQALNALVFLYREVLQIELNGIDAKRAKRTRRLPVVLTTTEVAVPLRAVSGEGALICKLIYGCRLRVAEVLAWRIKDVDMVGGKVEVRGGEKRQGPTHPAAGVTVLDLSGAAWAQTLLRRRETESKAEYFGSNVSAFDSKADDIGSNASAFDSKADDIGSNVSAFNSKADDIGSKARAFDSKADDIGSNARAFDSKADDIGSNARAFNSKADDIGSNARAFKSKACMSCANPDSFCARRGVGGWNWRVLSRIRSSRQDLPGRPL